MAAERRLRNRFTTPVPGSDGIVQRMSEGIYAHALEEDLATRLLPLARRGSGFRVSVIPDTEDARTLLADALAWDVHGERDTLEEVAWEFLHACAYDLVNYGEVVWEVCQCDPDGIALVFVQPETLKRRWFHTVQTSTDEDGLKRITRIPQERLIRVRTRDTTQLRRAHNILAGPPFSGAHVAPLLVRDGAPPVNMTELLKNETLALAQVGLICDWDGRTFFSDAISEFYFVTRILRFRRRAASIRDSLVEGINTAMTGANVSARLSITGLASAGELLALERDLVSGAQSLRAVRDALFGKLAE